MSLGFSLGQGRPDLRLKLHIRAITVNYRTFSNKRRWLKMRQFTFLRSIHCTFPKNNCLQIVCEETVQGMVIIIRTRVLDIKLAARWIWCFVYTFDLSINGSRLKNVFLIQWYLVMSLSNCVRRNHV